VERVGFDAEAVPAEVSFEHQRVAVEKSVEKSREKKERVEGKKESREEGRKE